MDFPRVPIAAFSEIAMVALTVDFTQAARLVRKGRADALRKLQEVPASPADRHKMRQST